MTLLAIQRKHSSIMSLLGLAFFLQWLVAFNQTQISLKGTSMNPAM